MFEQSLMRKQPKRRWGLTLTLAVAVHAVVLVTTVMASTWGIDAVEPPLVVEALRVTFPPPPLGGDETPARPPQPPPPVPQASPPPLTDTQPPVVPSDLPTAPAPPVTDTPATDIADTDAPSDGDGNDPEGDPWGPGPPGDSPSVRDDEAVALDARMTRPETLHRVQPRYTELARHAGRQGLVVLQATIDRGGRVTDVRLVKGLGFGLDEAAIDAVEQWRFRPAVLAGRPVPVYFQLSIQFTIR